MEFSKNVEDEVSELVFDQVFTGTAEDLYDQGTNKAERENYLGAIKEFNQVLRLNPNYAIAYYKRGACRYNLGDKQGAIEDYNQALKIEPQLAKAYCNRSLARYTLGDKQGALNDCNQALQINPNEPQAYYNRGLIYRGLGDTRKAIEDLQKAVKLFFDKEDIDSYKRSLDKIREWQGYSEQKRSSLPQASWQSTHFTPNQVFDSELDRLRKQLDQL